jgi:hypothetical protein
MAMRMAIAWAGALALLACDDAPRQAEPSAAAQTAAAAAKDTSAVTSHPSAVAPCAVSLWEGAADTTPTARRVARHPVSRGTHGMVSHVRWALSPDACAMLVVQDPVSIEADPLPNGFLLANERGPALFQRDDVWDVAPSASWTRLAYGRAFRTQPSGTDDSLSSAEWRRLAAGVGLDIEMVRRSAFSCSGMATLYCVARLYVADVSPRADGAPGATETVRALPVLAGWRVRWRADGSAILAGIADGSRDQAPPTRWVVVDPESGAVRDTLGAPDTAGLAPITWSEGPMLSYGVALDLASRSELPIDGAVIVSESGWIGVRWQGPSGTAPSYRVGVGRALAATRAGRFIAAIVPGRAPSDQEWAYELAVYEVSR